MVLIDKDIFRLICYEWTVISHWIANQFDKKLVLTIN